jgi:hypothetical protein
MSDHPDQPVELSGVEKALLVAKKATCPFIGSAIAQGKLSLRNEVGNPLASIEEVRELGNSGGGDLGDLLALFAAGNHRFMRGNSARLDKLVPNGLFSLEFPGSQGSHPGHSGILQGDPAIPGSGRLSEADFARLTSRARQGWIKRSEVGGFIAENLRRDPKAKVFGKKTSALLAGDLAGFAETIGPALLSKLCGSGEEARTDHRNLEEKLTRLLGEDNLVGSAGEFGLLFAFLANRPDAREIDGEPAVCLEDLQAMFVDKRLPDGWESWQKTRIDWVKHTAGLLISAGRQYRAIRHNR